MEYTINKLAVIAGISTRTLRYYDEIGLLKPCRVNSSGYRIYGEKEVDLLQQIMLFKEMAFSLEDIKFIIENKEFDFQAALKSQLENLYAKEKQIKTLIETVEKTLKHIEGEIIMSDKEKFKGFKQNLVDENEKKYGKEVREKYGDDVVNKSNEKVLNMSEEDYKRSEELTKQLFDALEEAFKLGDPASSIAQKACALHKEWLTLYWPSYSKEAHIGVCEMYVADDRFRVYYDKVADGCTDFLCEAVKIFCK